MKNGQIKIIVMNNEQEEDIISDIFDIALKAKGVEIFEKIQHVNIFMTKIVKPDAQATAQNDQVKEEPKAEEPKKEEAQKEPEKIEGKGQSKKNKK